MIIDLFIVNLSMSILIIQSFRSFNRVIHRLNNRFLNLLCRYRFLHLDFKPFFSPFFLIIGTS